MSAVAAALIPVFAVILVGVLLRITQLVKDEHWPAIDHLCYFLLFPVLIVKTLATADLSQVPVFSVALAMISTISAMSGLLYLTRKPLSVALGLSPAGFTSLFQGVTRWHAFVALSIIATLHGAPGITLTAIGIAAMTPFINLVNVAILSLYGANASGERRRPLLMIAKNPIIIGCLVGILLNVSPFSLPDPVVTTMDIIGRAALGIALLTVGAALRPAHVIERLPAVVATGALRLIGMPLMMALFCMLFGVTGMPLEVAVISAAVPTASAGYILARQMGGDADLMAAIITSQVLAGAFTLPFVIWLATIAAG